MVAALFGSAAVLIAMYFLLPALGLPRLDFTAVTAGWIRVRGKYARIMGTVVFVLGGLIWSLIYAVFWPWHSALGGMAFGLVPFAISCLTVLPELVRFRVMIVPMPGFIVIRSVGPAALAANLIEHLVFGLCLGLIY